MQKNYHDVLKIMPKLVISHGAKKMNFWENLIYTIKILE